VNDPVLLCYCSCPDAGSAQAIAEALVDERLAACVQSLPGMRSTYRWRGAVTTDVEVLLLIKTTAGALDALTRRVLDLHPYEVPEVIAVPVEHGHAAYLDWVRANVQTQGRSPRPGAKRGP
jgi:periplasmic divalent cation tolerance protein